MNRKAALQLSINAIVVLILAITILGLGLGFIKSQFGALQKQFGEVSAEIRSELIEKIRDSGELLVFNRAEIDAKVGKKDSFFFGIKNTASPVEGSESVCFRIAVRCLRSLKPDVPGMCTSEVENNAIVGGMDYDETVGDVEWFTVFPEIDIGEGEVGVYPISIQIPRAKPDTYLMRLEVFRDQGATECPGSEWEATPDMKKQFFVTLT